MPTPASFVDLHCHSTASDGTMRPAEVARLAKASGLSAFALTDHDTTAGLAEARDEAVALDIDFLNGIEISCAFPRPGTMHILGYGIDPESPTLKSTLEELIRARNERNERIVVALQAKGIKITMEQVRAVATRGDPRNENVTVGRPHIAKVLQMLGVVKNNAQAFRDYLGGSGLVYADKERLSSQQAIDLIHSAGGLACLAHAFQLRKDNWAQLRNEIKRLRDQGLDALEVVHTDHRESLVAELRDIAKHTGLLCTGGSDFHGSNKKHIQLGYAQNGRRVPREWFDRLVGKLKEPVD
ncbi:MAG: PHP domain-containing protein [Tepidisphaeraceae bacterium]